MASRLVRANGVTVGDVLDGRKLLEIDCVDRVYLTLLVPNLVVGGQVVNFLTLHEQQPIPSPVRLERRGAAFRRAVASFAEANDIPVLSFAGKRDKGRPGVLADVPVAGTQDRQGDAADAQGRHYGTVSGSRDRGGVGGTNPATSFTVNTLTGQRDPGGHAVVRALVHNTGGLAVDLTGTLIMSSVTGALTAGPYPAQLGTTLAPGQSEPVWFTLTSQVTNGPWNATVTLHSGPSQQAFRAMITFPRSQGTGPTAAARPVGGGLGLVAILGGAILIAIFAAVIAVIITRRRRRLS